MDCIVHGITKCRTQLSDFHFHWCIYVYPIIKIINIISSQWLLDPGTLDMPWGMEMQKETLCNLWPQEVQTVVYILCLNLLISKRWKKPIIKEIISLHSLSGIINTKVCGSELPQNCSKLLSFWFQPHKAGFDPGQILLTCGSWCLSLGSFSIAMFYDSGITYCVHDHISRLSKLRLMPLLALVLLTLPVQNFL